VRRTGALLLIWSAAYVAAVGCAATPTPLRSPVAATPRRQRPDIEWKHGNERERATRRQLERLLDQHDLSPWLFSRVVEISAGEVPHSHPVLTLSTRHLRDDLLLLATYVHEQSHWYFAARRDATGAAIAELEAEFPDLPVGFPDGADDREASYEHLAVNAFEYEALRELVGELAARQVLEFWATDHYRVIYRAVLERKRVILEVLARHGLVPPAPSAAAP
jgi:hypothetical protein